MGVGVFWTYGAKAGSHIIECCRNTRSAVDQFVIHMLRSRASTDPRLVRLRSDQKHPTENKNYKNETKVHQNVLAEILIFHRLATQPQRPDDRRVIRFFELQADNVQKHDMSDNF